MTKLTLTEAIQSCLNNGEKAFIPYIMAGDGGIESLKKHVLFLQEAGVTAIEVGIPFSDPVADGPTIQQAGERALQQGVTLRIILDELESFKDEVQIPLILMTYFNPILRFGIEAFANICARLGISGLIIPDLPFEESDVVRNALTHTDVALVPLVSLTSPLERIQKIAVAGEGFLYAVTINGITGVRNGFDDQLENHLKQLKEISPIPVLAGFGISTPAQVHSISALTDGVIVGSAIVDALHRNELEKVATLVDAAKEN